MQKLLSLHKKFPIFFLRKKKQIAFSFNAPSANTVFLTGSFNDWNMNGIRMQKTQEGKWETFLDLASGSYEYKFIVDGQWKIDPDNSNFINNSFGETNSLKKVTV